jgi:glycosyltransferase involved in cell wall biosynthesis
MDERRPMPDETVTIFLPTLNEIDGLRAMLPRIAPEWYDELIVVDGGSTDGTVEFLRAANIKVITQRRRGFANAYAEGFRASSGDIFITFTPDGNCIPELIPELIREARKGYDVVYVSRYLPPAKSYDDGLITGFGNFFFTWIVNVLFKARFTDLLGGFRAYNRAAVLKMGLDVQEEQNRFTQRFDLLNVWEVAGCIRAAKLRLAVKEIPGDEPKRIGGKSKVSILWNGSMLVAQIVFEIFLGRRFFKGKTERSCAGG